MADSPVARPREVKMPASGSSGRMNGSAARFEPAVTAAPNSSFMTLLNRGSVGEHKLPTIVRSPPVAHAQRQNGDAVPPCQKPIGTRSGSRSPDVFFTTDVGPNIKFIGGHYLKIDKIEAGEWDSGMRQLDHEFRWNDRIRDQIVLPREDSKKHMTVVLCFDDYRYAALADWQVSMIKAFWHVQYIPQIEYANAIISAGGKNKHNTKYFDGQAILAATFEGSMSEISTEGVIDGVKDLASQAGDIFAFKDIAQPSSPSWEFRVEFFEISAVERLLAHLTNSKPTKIGEWSITARPYDKHTKVAHDPLPDRTSPNATTPSKTDGNNAMMFYSPTGRTAWSRNANGDLRLEQPAKTVPKVAGTTTVAPLATPHRARFHSEPMPATPGHPFGRTQLNSRSGSWAAPVVHFETSQPSASSNVGEAQNVDRDRIVNGQDVRTTLMLRNLPNAWKLEKLLEILNETSKGKYDFSYLRIDFTHNTNVGYAFINFIDALCIVDFIDRYVGRPWECSGLRKIAQVSYATVQGSDCLIEKFRNSAIMDEFPSYCPKLWWSEESAPDVYMIGTERPFPPANNLSKKQRSHDNAGQMGLFAPRSGHRGADRHRRSQYDRGTTAQMQEDAALGAHTMVHPRWAMANSRGSVGPPPFPPTYDFVNNHHHVDVGSANGITQNYQIFPNGQDPFRNTYSVAQPSHVSTGRATGGGLSPGQTIAAPRSSNLTHTRMSIHPTPATAAASTPAHPTPMWAGPYDGSHGRVLRGNGIRAHAEPTQPFHAPVPPRAQTLAAYYHENMNRVPNALANTHSMPNHMVSGTGF